MLTYWLRAREEGKEGGGGGGRKGALPHRRRLPSWLTYVSAVGSTGGACGAGGSCGAGGAGGDEHVSFRESHAACLMQPAAGAPAAVAPAPAAPAAAGGAAAEGAGPVPEEAAAA